MSDDMPIGEKVEAREPAQPIDGPMDEERLTALDKLVLPRRAPMRALSEIPVGDAIPPSYRTLINMRSGDRVIE